MMYLKVLLVGSLMVLVSLLSGCLQLPPMGELTSQEEHSPQGFPPRELSPSERQVRVGEALVSPQVVVLTGKLSARGYSRLEGDEVVWASQQGHLVLIPFAEEPAATETVNPAPILIRPGRLTIPPEKGGSRRVPWIPPVDPSAAPAYVIYASRSGGLSQVFAVVNTWEEDHFLHIYPDGERKYRVFSGFSAKEVLRQLRDEARFREFEAWLRRERGASTISVGPVVVDEGTGTAYVFLSAVFSADHYLKGEHGWLRPAFTREKVDTYVMLARATGWEGGTVTLDPDSLWLAPRGNFTLGEGTEQRFGNINIVRFGEQERYRLIAGGEQPQGWPGLRNFAYFAKLPEGDAELLPTNVPIRPIETPGDQPSRQPQWGLQVFCWGLEDYTPENVLERFVPQPEMTLAAYNAAVQDADYGVVAVRGSAGQVFGFADLSNQQVQDYYQQALTSIDSRYLEVDLKIMVYLLKGQLEMRLEELGRLLLKLARAEKEGRFQEVYEELLPQGLDRLVMLFPYQDNRIPRFIRAIALEYARERDQGKIEPQIEPKLVIGAIGAPADALVDLIFDALADIQEGDPTPHFVRMIVKRRGLINRTWVMSIDKEDRFQLIPYWEVFLKPWLLTVLEDYGPPSPEVYRYEARWRQLIISWDSLVLNERPREAAVIGLASTFARVQKLDTFDAAGHARFKPMFHLLLKLLCFSYEAMAQEPPHTTDNKWVVAGVALDRNDPDQATVVMQREQDGRFFGRAIRKDFAVVNFYTNKFDDDQQEDVFNWIDRTVRMFDGDDWRYATNKQRATGLDIAAVVFTREPDRASVRKLARNIQERFGDRDICPDTPIDIIGGGIFLTWWEDDELWYSSIELGQAAISEQTEHEIVRGLMPGDIGRDVPINKYDPGEEVAPGFGEHAFTGDPHVTALQSGAMIITGYGVRPLILVF